MPKGAKKGEIRSLRHGHSPAGKSSPTYLSWANMLQRCNNPRHPRYADYGGRGITVCDRWVKFDNFLRDMGVRPNGMTLDRERNEGNYEPSNCRWATMLMQRRNSRNSFTAAEVTVIRARLADGCTGAEIARGYGVNQSSINRIRSGKTWR